MTNTKSPSHNLRQVDSPCITTHKAAINPLIHDYPLGDTLSQISAILAFVQSITLITNNKEGIQLPADTVTGLFYILQIAMDTMEYIGKCDLSSANQSTFLA